MSLMTIMDEQSLNSGNAAYNWEGFQSIYDANGRVYDTDWVDTMFKNNAVTEALRALSKRELINYAPYEAITMTTKGEKAAENVIFRHDALKQFFIEVLAVERSVAEGRRISNQPQ